jgi:hypothetical protein
MPCARPGCRNSDWNAVPEPPGRNRSTRRSPFFNVVDLVNRLGCPLLALTGPSQMSVTCPLSGEKRTLSKSRLTIRGGQPPSLDGGQVSRPHFALWHAKEMLEFSRGAPKPNGAGLLLVMRPSPP